MNVSLRLRTAPLLLGTAFLFAGAVQAASAPAEPARPDVDTLLEVIGFERIASGLVAGLDERFDAELDSGGTARPSPARAERIRALMHRAYTVERFTDGMAQGLAEGLSPDDTKALVADYRTPFGQRQLEAERTHDYNADQAAFAAFSQAFPDHGGQRGAHGAGGGADAADAHGRVGQRRRDRFADRDGRLPRTLDARHVLGGARTDDRGHPRAADRSSRRNSAGMLSAVLAWTYEDFTLEELDRLVAEAATPLNRRATAAMLDGMRAGFVHANLAFADELAAYVRLAEVDGEI